MKTKDKIVHDYKTSLVPNLRQHGKHRHSYMFQKLKIEREIDRLENYCKKKLNDKSFLQMMRALFRTGVFPQ